MVTTRAQAKQIALMKERTTTNNNKTVKRKPTRIILKFNKRTTYLDLQKKKETEHFLKNSISEDLIKQHLALEQLSRDIFGDSDDEEQEMLKEMSIDSDDE